MALSRRLTAAALALTAGICAIAVGRTAPQDRWWRDYGGSPDNSRYFPSKAITRKNVGRLAVAWTYPFGETGANPIVVRGMVYGRGRSGAIVALDARTGKEVWIHEGMQAMSARGMNYWESKDGADRRLIFTMNDYLQEIDAATGISIGTFGASGVVDLREGLGRDPATIGRIQSGTPGKIFENLVMLGSAPGEGYMSPPGDLRAYDVVTGALVWTFHTVPRPGEFGYDTWPKDAWKYVGAANTWGEITVDAERGIAYFPTGSPTYDYYGADRLGANLFGNCLLALDARTGKRLWHFQTVHHDLWDFDNNAAPQLTRIKQGGKSVDVVAMAGKTGFLYVFDRVTGTPIWPIEERTVPRSEVPGEQSWPTQPYPTQPPPFSRQVFTPADIDPYPIVTNGAREAFKKRVAGARNMGLFTPIDFVDTVHLPGSNGGALFGYTAAEPEGHVYVIGQNDPGVLKLVKPTAASTTAPGQTVYLRECQACHGPDRAGTAVGPTLLTLAGRMDASTLRSTIANGKGRMPAFPHISDVDLDALVGYLSVPAAGGRGRGAGSAPVFPAGPVVASGGAQARPPGGGRGRGARQYPEGVEPFPQYVIDAYGLIGTMGKPPFTTLTKYDLNRGAIAWQVGLGDHPGLAALGVTGTGTTQMRSSMIVTAGGLLFAPGGDGKVRAFDTDSGKVVWTTALGAAIRGAPSMYEIEGRQYLLVAASGDIAGAGVPPGGAATALPKGYVAYALRERN
jgi:quinoprotein glucose dehydrogenase